jgi:hypothetical protein
MRYPAERSQLKKSTMPLPGPNA